MDYRSRRQFLAFFALIVIVFGAGYLLFQRYGPLPTCTDYRKNGGETEVDCGGECDPCALRNREPLLVYWARLAPSRPETYDVAAEIRNPNARLAVYSFDYSFKLYDSTGVTIAERTGSSYIYPGETIHVVEFGLLSPRPVARVELAISNEDWIVSDVIAPDLFAGNRKYGVEAIGQSPPASVLGATLSNRTIIDVSDITVVALILDTAGNLVGAHRTAVNLLEGGKNINLTWSWPVALPEPTGSIIVEPRSRVLLDAASSP